MIYLPIIGAFTLAAGTIIVKKILSEKKVGIKLYQSAEFLAITIVMLPFLYFFWKLDSQAFELQNILILAGIIIFSIIANLFVFYSMKWEKISNLEPARVLEPLFVIFIAIVFSFIFGETLFERNTNILIPGLIAGAALIFSHVRKHHLNFNKYFVAAIIGSFFFACEMVMSRLILDFYSPISFYFVRCALITFVCLIIFKPKLKKLETKLRWKILGLGFLLVTFRIIMYYGYVELGVVHTTLILMLGPVLIYVFAWKFLKEKLDWKNVVAGLVIVASVVYGILV